MKQLIDSAKESPVIAGVFVVMGLLGGGGGVTLIDAIRTYDDLATVQYVDEAIGIHAQVAEQTMNDIAEQLNRIRAFTEIVPELENLYTLRCMGTQNLDGSIRQLENQYRALTGEEYDPKSCERLLAAVH